MLKEDNLEDEIKNLGHQGSAESRQRIWAEVRRALDEQQQQAAGEQPQIWRDIMIHGAAEGDVVADPFAGSNPLMAALYLNPELAEKISFAYTNSFDV